MKILGIIPARYSSTRFPGKPLAIIAGKSMVERVYNQTKKALDFAVVATDNQEIFNHVKSFGGEVILTSVAHNSGTSRCAEALVKAESEFKQKFTHVINIQGDEPFIQANQIKQLIEILSDNSVEIATLAQLIKDEKQLFDPNVVKLVFSLNNRAIYFSRATIPYVRGCERENWFKKTSFYKHIGIYGYRSDILLKLSSLEEHLIEKMESLEQNRWLAHDILIKVGLTEYESPSVDTLEDLTYIEELINRGILEA